MIYYGNKKIANNNVHIHGDTITIENNAQMKVVNLITDLPSSGDEVLYAVKEDHNIYFWDENNSSSTVTRTLQVSGTTGTTPTFFEDGTSGYAVEVTRNIGPGRTNISVSPTYAFDYDSVSGNITITLTSSSPRTSVTTTVTYREAVSTGGWTVFGPVAETMNVLSNGAVVSPNADYAEIGKWSSNVNPALDHVGKFVAIDTDSAEPRIKIATSTDDVRGVVVNSPAFVAGYSEDKYYNGELLPSYAYVGFAGQINVKTDGTSIEVGDRVMPNDDGVATKSSNNMGYQVIQVISSTEVKAIIELSADMIQRIKSDVVALETSVDNLDTRLTEVDEAISQNADRIINLTSRVNTNKKHIADLNEMLKGYVYDSTEVVGDTIPSTVEVSGTTYNVLDGAKGVVSKVEGDTNNLDGVLYATEYSGVKVSSPNLGVIATPSLFQLNNNGVIFSKNAPGGSVFVNTPIPNGDYTLCLIPKTLPNIVTTFAVYDGENVSDMASFVFINSFTINNRYLKNITITNGTLKIVVYNSGGYSNFSFMFMITKGSTPPTTFIPYYEPKTLLPYPTTLNGVEGSRDTLEIRQNASGLYDVYKVSKTRTIALNGSEQWVKLKESLYQVYVSTSYPIVTTASYGLYYNSNYGVGSGDNIWNGSSLGFTLGYESTSLIKVQFRTETDMTTADMKAMLQSKNAIITYIIATPTEELLASNLSIDDISAKYSIGGSVEVVNSNSIYGNSPKTTSTIVYKKFGA